MSIDINLIEIVTIRLLGGHTLGLFCAMFYGKILLNELNFNLSVSGISIATCRAYFGCTDIVTHCMFQVVILDHSILSYHCITTEELFMQLVALMAAHVERINFFE